MANLRETAEWVEGIYQIEKTDPVVGGEDGVSNRQAKQLGNRTAYLKAEVEKRAPTNNPAFTGAPTAPTPKQSVNSEQIATTAFVKTAIAALVGSAPAALDTLAELANALGDDANIKQVLLAEIGNKASKSEFTSFLDLFIGVPIAIPTAALPEINIPGYTVTALDGGRFSTSLYPKLAKVYPSGVKPDARGEFIRGWDNGRNVDSGRQLLSAQSDEFKSHRHTLGLSQADDFNPGHWITSSDTTHSGALIEVNGNAMGFSGGNETRPRNIAYQYVCLAA